MVLIEDIYDFLPKYPNIIQDKNDIFNPYNRDFYSNIYHKKEFYDEKLDKVEDFPEDVGGLLKHQKIIAKFFSSHTDYNELLLVHEMGTGKSCSAIGAIEEIKSNGGFRKVLYLAKGEALINNFLNELIFKCTDGRYIPENYEKLTKLEQTHRKKKMVKDYYNFNTFETFAKYIKNTQDTQIHKEYDNTIIVIDEVHNLRIQEKIGGLNLYEQFLRFLHLIKGCKILLLSGTPMKDNVKEIASVMNLILPFKKDEKPYLPTGDEFLKEFFDKKSNDLYKIKPQKIPELKLAFKGRVSYLRAMQSNIKIIYEGSILGKLKHFNVIQDKMSSFQSNKYKEAYNLDTQGDKEGIYSNSRQASLFVFPDGTYGKEGFEKYIKTNKSGKTFIDDMGKKKKTMSFSLTKELKNEINADTEEEKLNKLYKFSSKYADTIKNILDARDQGKCVFVYNEFVVGGGLILFGLLLELFGFTKASGKENNNDESPRYASLTNLTSTDTQIRNIVSRFNRPDNVKGKIINIIIGSRKISEGFSFQNIQIEEILSPWFNYSETAQAIARGIRLGSHRLLEEQQDNVSVQIFQRVSIPTDGISIDLYMYETSEQKDISIKSVERIIKESAFDCALTYNRNKITGKDGQRECEYMDCIYNCEGIPSNLLEKSLTNPQLDFSTYQLYYNKNRINKLIEKITNIFQLVFSIDFMSIKLIIDDDTENFNEFEILTALKTIINTSKIIINKYGLVSYLKEHSNIYFLIDNLSLKGTISSEYYTEFPHITTNYNFYNIVKPIYYSYLPNIINKIYSTEDLSEIRKLLVKLPTEIVEFILEQSILAYTKNLTKNKNSREKILEYFKGFYQKIDNTWISSYLYDEEETLRCLDNNIWKDCDENITKKYIESIKEQIINLENNPYGYYGQVNPETNLFCIRDVSEEKKEKKHQRTRGQNCLSYKLPQLYDIAINYLELPLPEEKIVKQYLQDKIKKKYKEIKIKELPPLTDKDALWNIITKFKNINTMFTDKNKLSAEDMVRILFWGTMQKEPICESLRDWFKDNNLLVIDKGCGDTGKKKM